MLKQSFKRQREHLTNDGAIGVFIAVEVRGFGKDGLVLNKVVSVSTAPNNEVGRQNAYGFIFALESGDSKIRTRYHGEGADPMNPHSAP
ncbi:hypothetical protein SLA2020_518830 [Shorea laevis]